MCFAMMWDYWDELQVLHKEVLDQLVSVSILVTVARPPRPSSSPLTLAEAKGKLWLTISFSLIMLSSVVLLCWSRELGGGGQCFSVACLDGFSNT